MKIYSIAGWSGSGKTTLITKLIKNLKGNGKTVMVLKNAPQKIYLEPESKDSISFLHAGAELVFLSSQKQLMKIEFVRNEEEVLKNLEKEFDKFDFVFLEGLTGKDIPIIEVFDKGSKKGNNKLKITEADLFLIVSDSYKSNSVKVLKRDDIEGIIKFIKNFEN